MSYTQQPAHMPYPGPPSPPPVKSSNGLAVAGFVLGLLGLLSSWIPVLSVVGILMGVIGAVLAGVGLSKASKVNAGKGLAIAGIVLGALGVIIAILINVVFVGAVDNAIDEAVESGVTSPGSGQSGGDAPGDGAAGSTRANPAPLGSAVTGDDWTVTVHSAKEISEDSLDQTAAAGSILIAVNLTATYEGDDEQGTTPWVSVDYVSPDGTTFDSLGGSTMFIADNEFDSFKTVYPGGSVKGDMILGIPAGNWKKGVFAVSPAMMSDDTFVAVK